MTEPIVDPDWLSANSDDVVVCDVRTSMTGDDPAAAYATGHVPGARFVDLDTMLADPPDGERGRHPLPTPERFASALGAAGVGDDVTVVAYDDRGGAFAARLVWMLRVVGQDAALLDGGLAAWPGPTETGSPDHEPAERRAIPWPAAAVVDAAGVVGHIEDGGFVVDSREAPRYRGEVEPIDPVAGHVPGAINLPFAGNLDEHGRFRPAASLAARFEALTGGPDAVVYCGSGVTACHNALAIERAGLPLPRVYVGSWSGWTADPSRPVATGPEPD